MARTSGLLEMHGIEGERETPRGAVTVDAGPAELNAAGQDCADHEAVDVRQIRAIAHDFNNLLGVVLGFSKLLVADLEANSPQRGYAERIVAATEKGRELVTRLRAARRAP